MSCLSPDTLEIQQVPSYTFPSPLVSEVPPPIQHKPHDLFKSVDNTDDLSVPLHQLFPAQSFSCQYPKSPDIYQNSYFLILTSSVKKVCDAIFKPKLLICSFAYHLFLFSCSFQLGVTPRLIQNSIVDDELHCLVVLPFSKESE